jgi:hypothetical protein
VFAPVTSVGEQYEQEYQKGEISGIFLTSNLLPLTIEAYEDELEHRREKETQEDA